MDKELQDALRLSIQHLIDYSKMLNRAEFNGCAGHVQAIARILDRKLQEANTQKPFLVQ